MTRAKASRSGGARSAPLAARILPDWLADLIAGHEAEAEWAIKAWQRAAAQPGAWFDHAKADRVVALWPTLFKLTDLRFAGHPFRLEWWQEIIVRLLVGWKYPVEYKNPATGAIDFAHVRLFRELRLWLPRKNGKSEFLVALALLFWAIDGVLGGQGFVYARNEEQADIPFAKMKAMCRLFPEETASRFQINDGSIWSPPLAAGMVRLTGSESGKHGKAPYVRLGDEMHEWKSRKVDNDLRQGSGVHLQPIGLLGSTAGIKTNMTGLDLWDESHGILDGTVEDPSTLVVIFAADPDDDWQDEATWHRANPNLHVSITLDYLRGEARKAKRNKRAEAQFRCYHLNQWVEDSVKWLDLKEWDACAANPEDWRGRWDRFAGRRCFGAFDLSSVRDITAAVYLFPPDETSSAWQSVCRFWLPEAALAEREKVLRDRIERFVDAGAITLTPGNIVDQDFIKQTLLDGFDQFDVDRVGFDPWNSTKLVTDLQKEGLDAEQLVQIRQGIISLGEPSKEFERLVYSGQFDHGGDPVLRFMAGNTTIRFDENLNFMPAKRRSAEKIDGIMAAVMALAVAMNGEDSAPASPWDDPDFSLSRAA